MEGKLSQHLHQVEEEDTTAVDLDVEDFEILEHEQAHVVAMASAGCDSRTSKVEEESSRLNQSSVSNLDPFLDQFSGMINHTNLQAILGEQDHM